MNQVAPDSKLNPHKKTKSTTKGNHVIIIKDSLKACFYTSLNWFEKQLLKICTECIDGLKHIKNVNMCNIIANNTNEVDGSKVLLG